MAPVGGRWFQTRNESTLELTAESSTLNFSQQGKPRIFDKMDRIAGPTGPLLGGRWEARETGRIPES